MSYAYLRHCGCYFGPLHSPKYLPLVGSDFHTTVFSTSYSTNLTQTFHNPSKNNIEQAKYVFPLFDGISVGSFTCEIGEKTLYGVVHEKIKAKEIFNDAVAKGQSAGLFEQSDAAADVFSTSLGNIASGATIVVEICYVGELKNDAEADGIRLTIPTAIAPRYGSGAGIDTSDSVAVVEKKGISITVDAHMPKESPIKSIQSPSHPIAVSMGVLSSAKDADMSPSKSSATLSLGEAALEKDFVLVVNAKDSGNPTAVLETHPTIPHQRALMTSLVPRFSLPAAKPEIVFIADRSGSMSGNIPMLQNAMRVFLKSLPPGIKFNILSFGSRHSFLWPKSQTYSKDTQAKSLAHVDTFGADYGGTETLSALKAAVSNRFTDLSLDMILLTDGDIWAQENAFKYVSEEVEKSKGAIRLFPLGIGNGVSHSLIDGLARAGNGFSQAVQDGERLDKRVVRMLRGALSPHIYDYTLEVKYGLEDDDFEMVDKAFGSATTLNEVGSKASAPNTPSTEPGSPKKRKGSLGKVISLFSKDDPEKQPIKAGDDEPLPDVAVPSILQAPYRIPSLFSFSRTTVYLLLSPETIQKNPTSVVLRGTIGTERLELEIPVQVLDALSQTIHQLAARKVVQDLEEGRGWVYEAKDGARKLKDKYPSRFEDVVKREAVRLGETFQIANKWCSFVAVPAETKEKALTIQRKKDAKVKGSTTTKSGGGAPSVQSASTSSKAYTRDVEREESDEDMGYGLFDDNLTLDTTSTACPAPSFSPASPIVSSRLASSATAASYSVSPAQFKRLARRSVAPAASPKASPASMVGWSGSKDTQASSSGGSMAYGTAPPPPGPVPFAAARSTSGLSGGMAPTNRLSRGAASRSRLSGGAAPPGNPSGKPKRETGKKTSFVDVEAEVRVSKDPSDDQRTWLPGAQLTVPPVQVDQALMCRYTDEGSELTGIQVHLPDEDEDEMLECEEVDMAEGVEADMPKGEQVDMPKETLAERQQKRVLAIIALQDFDGFWRDSPELWEALDFIKKANVQKASGKTATDEVWITLVVLSCLEVWMKSEKEVWELVTDKARMWLDDQKIEDGEKLEESARATVGEHDVEL